MRGKKEEREEGEGEGGRRGREGGKEERREGRGEGRRGEGAGGQVGTLPNWNVLPLCPSHDLRSVST
jgi:hypothetical protein